MKNIKRKKIIISGTALFCCGMILFAVILIAPSETYSDFSSQDINGDSVVLDNRTGLIWQANEPGAMDWNDAIDFCQNLTYGGYSNWRLPTIKELLTIAALDRYNPSIDPAFFLNCHLFYYWSATTEANYATYAWDIHFSDGNISSGYKTDPSYVRCVR